MAALVNDDMETASLWISHSEVDYTEQVAMDMILKWKTTSKI